MIESVLLVEGRNVADDALRRLSLGNAKQLVYGRYGETGTVLHLAATTHADLQAALIKFSEVDGVSSVLTLAVRSDA